MLRPIVVITLATLFAPALQAEGAPQSAQKAPAARKATAKPKPAVPAPVAPSKPEPAPLPPPRATDVRMKTAITQGAQVSHNTTYLQGPRQRVEFPGIVALDQCDLGRSVMLSTAAKRFRVDTYPAAASTAAQAAPPLPEDQQMARMMGAPAAPQPRGGVVSFTTTLTDTLERETMLGLEARHIKTLVIKQASASACDTSPLKVEMDAWYVDLPAQSSCSRPASPVAPPPPASDACTDRIETRIAGDVKLGFPVKVLTTTTTGEGDKLEVTSSLQEVTELEITRLDRALFDVPADYTEARSGAEIVPALATGGSLADAIFGSTADGSSTAAPKKPGMIRIGILEPLNRTGRNLPPSSIRQELVAKFNKAPYEAIAVAGSSPAAIDQEAARLQCDYLMLTEIVEAKTSKPGKLGGMMRMTGGGPPKDAHDVKLDYQLFAVGATQTPRLSGNAKASNGGFGVGSALRLAAFAGQLYLGVMMGGMGMGLMNPIGMSGVTGMGSMSGFFDPRASAMSSMFSGFGGGSAGMGGAADLPGMGDPSEAGLRETVSDALGKSAKAAMEQLGKKK